MTSATRAAAAAVVALVAGLLVSFVAASALRAAAPEAGLLWRAASPATVAGWTLAGAHGAALRVEAGAEIRSEPLRRIGERVGDIFGRDDPLEGAQADARVRLASLTILGIAGAVLAAGLRLSGAATPAAAATAAGVAGVVYGAGMALVALTSRASLGFDGQIVSAGVDASVSPVAAFVGAAIWGAVFALAGALSIRDVAAGLAEAVRAIGAGVRAGVIAAASVATVLLVVLLLVRGVGGDASVDGGLLVVGIFLLAPNAIAAAVVLAHGAVMSLSFDVGPLDGWTSLSYATDDLTAARWLFVLVPLAAGVLAGRAMRRRTDDVVTASLGFGAAWGLVLGALAILLRIEVASSFSISSIAPGGGARVQPFVAVLLGSVIGAVTSAAGMLIGVRPPPAQTPPSAAPAPQPGCPSCGAAVPPGDRFCSACGAEVG